MFFRAISNFLQKYNFFLTYTNIYLHNSAKILFLEGVTCKLPTEEGLLWDENYNGASVGLKAHNEFGS